ncbi:MULTISPECIES: hypothetical protein [unclassified Streptomyces]|uniref:hypothetical protein n=1 Tax=unclassified Streptomyces TaxID=2593676 RepID=UPI0035DE634E
MRPGSVERRGLMHCGNGVNPGCEVEVGLGLAEEQPVPQCAGLFLEPDVPLAAEDESE